MLTVAAVFITGIIALLADMPFAKMRFKGKKCCSKHDRSADVCSSGCYDYTAVPIIKILGLVNTRVSVILIYIGIMLPMTIYLMRNFMKTVPDSFVRGSGD